MKCLSVLPALLLTGCFYQTVNQFDIERASKACGGVEKVVEISSFYLGDEVVFCKNGKEYNLRMIGVE